MKVYAWDVARSMTGRGFSMPMTPIWIQILDSCLRQRQRDSDGMSFEEIYSRLPEWRKGPDIPADVNDK